MGTLANNEDPDEMAENTAFHQGLLFFAEIKTIFRETGTEIHHKFEIPTCDPLK